MGMLYVTEDDFACLSGCEVGQAEGEVTINLLPGERVGLWVEAEQLGALRAINANDLYWLHLEAASDPQMVHVSHLTGLREIVVSAFDFPDAVTDIGIKRLKTLKSLEKLTLHDVGISADALNTVASLKSLRSIVFSKVQLTDEALQKLLALPYLTELSFYDVPISHAGIRTLGDLRSLKKLNLWKTNVSSGFRINLEAQFPNCTITGL